MIDLIGEEKSLVEPVNESAIASHESYNKPVHAVCHHSKRYLTRKETNPIPRTIFHEQHEFPGSPQLDKKFYDAAHAQEFQHMIWSHLRFLAVALFLLPMVMIIIFIFLKVDPMGQSSNFWILLLLSVFISIGGVDYLWRHRDNLFHKLAKGKNPSIPEFPVECTYRIEAEEEFSVDLGNKTNMVFEVKVESCYFSVKIHPSEEEIRNHSQYRKLYGQNHKIYAGVLALSNLAAIKILDDAADTLDLAHRIILLANPETFSEQGFSKRIDYTVDFGEVLEHNDGWQEFPLDFYPQIAVKNSRCLDIFFYWWGGDNDECVLERCELHVPDELEPVTWIEMGLYEQVGQTVLWQNIRFSQKRCRLSVVFNEPILSCHENLVGNYKIILKGKLLSGLKADAEHVWTSKGFRVESGRCVIKQRTVIQGELTINPQLLSQEHEYTPDIDTITYSISPSDKLVKSVLDVLQEKVEIQRIARSLPRLNPIHGNAVRYYYWDILGQIYHPQLFTPIEIHVVIRGFDPLKNSLESKAISPQTQISIHPRTYHDPRDKQTPQMVDSLLGGSDGPNSLRGQIETALNQLL